MNFPLLKVSLFGVTFLASQILPLTLAEVPPETRAAPRRCETQRQSENGAEGQRTRVAKAVGGWLVWFFQINEETHMAALLGKDQYSPKFVQAKVSQSDVSDLKNNKPTPIYNPRRSEVPPLSK